MQCVCTLFYLHLRPVWLYHILPHYLIIGPILGKFLQDKICVFSSLKRLSETFLIFRRVQRDMINNKLLVQYPLFLANFSRTWIFSSDFRKHSDIKYHENLSIRIRGFPCGRTDMTNLMLAFGIFANAPIQMNVTSWRVWKWKIVILFLRE